MKREMILIILGIMFLANHVFSQIKNEVCNIVPGSEEMPLIYEGLGMVDSSAPDGNLMYLPGVQNIEINRANRTHPPSFPMDPENHIGWTYQHHVDIGCWKGLLYGVWDMTHKGEDNPPARLVYATSSDGFNWSQPAYLFPPDSAYNLRFYFYHASNGRMLAFGAGWYPTDNISESLKTTLLVREISSDHRLGTVYTLINPGPTYPPLYTESDDSGFVAACEEAYNHNLLLEQQDYGIFLGDRRMKWHDSKNWPGGEVPSVGGKLWIFGKALCFFHRKDNTLVGISKMGFVTISKDEGKNWSLPIIPDGIVGGGGKLWGQKMYDGKYAMLYAPQKRFRYPMVITTSDDGIIFRDMRVIHGEVPPQRYEGRAKPVGPQYIRGIAEWGGDSSSIDDSSNWVIYSVGKEDIWVSRIPIPLDSETKEPVNDNFDIISPGPRVPNWNTYSPLWAPVSIVKDPIASNNVLELKDQEPADYARAIRTFPISKKINLSFRVYAAQSDLGRLEIELLGVKNERPIRIIFNDKAEIITVDQGESKLEQTGKAIAAISNEISTEFKLVCISTYKPGEWLDFNIFADCESGTFDLEMNGNNLLKGGKFAQPAEELYALSLRTGEFRSKVLERAKTDQINTEEPGLPVIFRIDDVKTSELNHGTD